MLRTTRNSTDTNERSREKKQKINQAGMEFFTIDTKSVMKKTLLLKIHLLFGLQWPYHL